MNFTRKQAKDYLKNQLESYLRSKGINTNKPFKCLDPAHADRKPSMSYDRSKNKVKCFSCNAGGDIFDVIGLEYGLTAQSDIFTKAYELFNITIENDHPKQMTAEEAFSDDQKQSESEQILNGTGINQETTEQLTDFRGYFLQAKENLYNAPEAIAYLNKRGLSTEIINKFNLGYDPNWHSPKLTEAQKAVIPESKRIIIPTSNNSYLARDINQNCDPRFKAMKAGKINLFNKEVLYNTQGEPIFICEAEIDALSVIEAGGQALALGSANNGNKLIAELKNKPTKNKLILSLDNDKIGREATEKLKQELTALNIKYIVVNISGEHKDQNEALTADRELFKQDIKNAINYEPPVIIDVEPLTAEQEEEKIKAEYIKTCTAYYINDFIRGIKESVDTPYIPTGFFKLDYILDGGLYEGLYIIGAISSLGKTTFVLQMCDQIAEAKQDVLIFSLEMARTELMAKSISRTTFELTKIQGIGTNNAKTARGITTGKRHKDYNEVEQNTIKEAINIYSQHAENIFISEGMGDIGAVQIREAVIKHINLTGNKPVVIIDYLQLLAPYSERSTDKQNTDKAVLELKRLSRDFKIPVIAISSFNRQSYKDKVTMEAFKESGAIEYSSDVLIGIQAKKAGEKDFNIDEAKAKDPREIELKILKNRNGATGETIEYEYYPMFNYFVEGGSR